MNRQRIQVIQIVPFSTLTISLGILLFLPGLLTNTLAQGRHTVPGTLPPDEQSNHLFLPMVAGAGKTDGEDGNGAVTISGELKQWHKVTLSLAGPQASETGTPNPFLDYRMAVTFSNGELSYMVPGYFAADGNAAESSATAGNVWRAHLSPDLTGEWHYTIHFQQGDEAAVNGGGKALAPYDGLSGSFTVAATDKSGRDLRGKGRLQYVNQHYLRFAGTGEYFLKIGTDSPETLLAYSDFDGTYVQESGGAPLKSYSAHVGDWQAGDPTWQEGKGKGLIGALTYLASEEQNAVSFLTYNAGGDGRNVWPFVAYDARLRYDVSKLDQWNIVFDHADQMGFYLHFKTQETENDNGSWGLDGGELGVERKLYYRELIARFGYHLALNWNLGEENSQTTAQQRTMAQYFADNDSYHHLVVIHTAPGEQTSIYNALLGNVSTLTGASLQNSWNAVHALTLLWLESSSRSAKPWVVANDEQGPADIGVPPDLGYEGYKGASVSQADIRQRTLWGNLMAGGAGVEYYFGYEQPCDDLDCEDFRSRDAMWDYNRHALHFFQNYLPFAEMASCNDLIPNADQNGYCFAKAGELYAIYLPHGGTQQLNLSDTAGVFRVQWYDPRNGGPLIAGAVTSVTGGSQVDLGLPPDNPEQDWVILLQRR